MRLKKLPDTFTVCKVEKVTDIDLNSDIYFIGKTDEELSLVCRTENVPENTVERDDGRRDPAMSSPLYERIYDLVRRIPAGKVATYGQIAFLLGIYRGARTVGFAMAACRDPSVPCHRVVNRFGGTCPAFDVWVKDTQKKLLLAEGVRFDEEGRVDLSVSGWDGTL